MAPDVLDLVSPSVSRTASIEDASSEYDQLKGQFLASLNHELRTPLSGVLGMTDLLLETQLDGEQREYAQTVRECASQLLETLNAVLDYSSLSAGNFRLEETEFHPAALLDSLIADTSERARGKGLQFSAATDPALPDIAFGDERYIRQLLIHLLRNAVKFTSRGQIELNTRVESASGSRIWLRFEIRDTGIGIPPEKLKLIFESFRQLESGLSRSYAGLGLGLALARRIVEWMKGQILVDSEHRAGTTITVRLPLRVPLREPAAPRAAAADACRNILVVDDNSIARRVVSHILERASFRISLVASGEEAIQQASQTQFDLVLMDLQMPGIDGLAATKAIRQIPGYEVIPILALSANCTDEHRLLCHQIGMQGFLAKPIQKEELVNTVRRLLP